MNNENEIENPSVWAVTLSALRASFARPSLWLFTWGVLLLLSVPFALAYHQGFVAMLGNHYEPGSQLAWMTEDFRTDHRPEMRQLNAMAATGFAILAVIAQLAGVFFAGGWLQVLLERTSGRSLRRFLWGGARTFWRFSRLWLVVVAFYMLLSWIFLGAPFETLIAKRFDAHVPENLAREDVALMWKFLPGLFVAIGLWKVKVWALYTRARLALLNTRSVTVAGTAVGWMMFRHPLRTFGPMLLLFLFELPVVALLGFISKDLDGELDPTSSWKIVLVMFGLSQVSLIFGQLLFGARYAAALRVCRTLIRTAEEPDPFADRVGGPGGPQYPIDDSDEYGVSY